MMREYFQFPQSPSAYAVIWLHGLGSSGIEMKGIAKSLDLSNLFVRHVFLDAPKRPVTINQGMVMPAWYDIVGTQFTDREDKAGIESSKTQINDAIRQLRLAGFQSKQIILAGFSQGAAMALYTSLHEQDGIGGVVMLSGYLPLATTLKPALATSTPMFIGYGRYDPIVMPAWTQLTIQQLESWGYGALTIEDYPIDHRICAEELTALSVWMRQL